MRNDDSQSKTVSFATERREILCQVTRGRMASFSGCRHRSMMSQTRKLIENYKVDLKSVSLVKWLVSSGNDLLPPILLKS